MRRIADTDFSAVSYVGCIRLAIRAYSGLLSKHFDSEQDLDQLSSQIMRLTSDQSRIFLWSDLALKYFTSDRISDGKKIVATHVRPLLEAIKARNSWEWQETVAMCAPALYQNHKSSTLEIITKLDPLKRDEASTNAISFILRKAWQFEPYESGALKDSFELNFEQALDVCELLEHIDQDSAIYNVIRQVVDSVFWRPNKPNFTQQQRVDLAQRLSSLVSRKLPNQRFIQHDGFKIVSQAQVARLQKQRQLVEELILQAKGIKNVADRAFILAEIASSDSNLDFEERVNLIREAKKLVDQIPAALDRAYRYERVAEASRDIDIALCKQCVREAFGLIPKDQAPESESLRRQIVDFAHQIDPSLASSIATSLDDDEARKEVRNRIAMRDFQKKLADGSVDEDSAQQDAEKFAKAAWSLLGQLQAGRIEAQPVSATRQLVKIASSKAMSQAYPILSWFIQNAISRRKHAEQSKKLLRGIYDGTLVGCELSFRLGGRTSDRFRKLVISANKAARTSLIVHSGDRENALEFLGKWLSENAKDYLKICDPYFDPEDLDVLQLILGSVGLKNVSILASRKQQEKQGSQLSIEERFKNRWREISDQSPPETEIVIVGNANGDLPIHDRWWITKGAGLRMGTSFKSLGDRKESEISHLDSADAAQCELEIDEFLTLRKREHNGEKLSIQIFTL